MADLNSQFEQASQDAKSLSSKPSNNDLLALYSLYKQGTEGDCTGKRPGMTNIKGRAKFDAWKKIDGLSKDDAMQQYIDKVAALKN